MLSNILTVTLFLTSLSCAATLPHTKRGFDILRLPVVATNLTDQRHKRQEVSPLENSGSGTLYLVSFSIGTPPQNVSLHLDTGSSETWVDPNCSTAGGFRDLCDSLPVYDPTTSSTSQNLKASSNISYGRGEVDIKYFSDNFVIEDATIAAQKFGVASSSNEISTGIMGVGPGIEFTGYPIILDSLASQGFINSRAFSLDLRSVDSPSGAIIFGGIDTMKYTGTLEKCPIIPPELAPDKLRRYWIYMKSVGITKPGESPKLYAPASSDPQGQAIVLDSGATLSHLPLPLVEAIAADFQDAKLDASSGYYVVDCSVADQDGSVDFGFGNTIIHVPYHEFIWHQADNLCVLGIRASKFLILGDSFLRAAFVVYDQDNQNLHLANAANCGTNLVAIGKGVDAVPSVTGACGASSSSSSSTTTSQTKATSPIETTSLDSSPIQTTSTNGHSSTGAAPSESTTSTVYTTSVYTITSCAATITDCPGKIGSITTEVISLYTTICPVISSPSSTVAAAVTPSVSPATRPPMSIYANATGYAPFSSVTTSNPTVPSASAYQQFTGGAEMIRVANIMAILVAAMNVALFWVS